VKSPRFACRIGSFSATTLAGKGRLMKRSRRVVLTLMGSAAVSAVSVKLAVARPATCGPGHEAVPGLFGSADCQAVTHGFGGSFHRVSSHDHPHTGG
jgi:hypothetical protein